MPSLAIEIPYAHTTQTLFFLAAAGADPSSPPPPHLFRFHCEAFALRIFANADKVDCAGRADANTAKAYYAASFFIEVCVCV